MPNLFDHHCRHIIELLEQGRDLPIRLPDACSRLKIIYRPDDTVSRPPVQGRYAHGD